MFRDADRAPGDTEYIVAPMFAQDRADFVHFDEYVVVFGLGRVHCRPIGIEALNVHMPTRDRSGEFGAVPHEDDFFVTGGVDGAVVLAEHDMKRRHLRVARFVEYAQDFDCLLDGTGAAAPAVIVGIARRSATVGVNGCVPEVIIHSDQAGLEPLGAFAGGL